MDDHIAVVSSSDLSAPAVEEGTKEHVVEWLKEQSDISGYLVYFTSLRAYFCAADILEANS